MDRRPTYILLVILAVLAGWWAYQKKQKTVEPGVFIAPLSETSEPVEFLFPAERGVVISLDRKSVV